MYDLHLAPSRKSKICSIKNRQHGLIVFDICFPLLWTALRSNQKFCNRYWQFYKTINIQETVA